MKKTIISLLILCSLSSCSYILTDVDETKNEGNKLFEAIKKYKLEKGEYPITLDLLVPKYIKTIPHVQNKSCIPCTREFNYSITDFIPKEGDFTITFRHKKDQKEYKYNSQNDTIEWTGTGFMNAEAVDENITFEEVNKLASVIKTCFIQEKKYPPNLNYLIPKYIKKMPFNINAKYKSGDIPSPAVEYSFNQPCDTFRGDCKLFFTIGSDKYFYMGKQPDTNEIYWYHSD